MRAALALAVLAAPALAAENRFPKAAAAYLVERDGRVLWAGGESRRLQPASLAKMMTALLVIEGGRLDEIVTVSGAAAKETGTRLGLREGERYPTRGLLAAAIVRSANDACRALADFRGGKSFVPWMNARAKELGMKDTRFADPCGHDAAGQHTTAADMAALARAVAAKPEYMALAGMERAELKSLHGERSFTFANTNALIGRYSGALGLKTGTTPEAGTCLAALAERGGARVLLIMLGAKDRWWGGDVLLDRAFAAP